MFRNLNGWSFGSFCYLLFKLQTPFLYSGFVYACFMQMTVFWIFFLQHFICSSIKWHKCIVKFEQHLYFVRVSNWTNYIMLSRKKQHLSCVIVLLIFSRAIVSCILTLYCHPCAVTQNFDFSHCFSVFHCWFLPKIKRLQSKFCFSTIVDRF